MWVRNTVTAEMRSVTPKERKTLDPNKWVLVTGYKAPKVEASEEKPAE